MKTDQNYLARLSRLAKIGAVLGMAMFAVSALQAQNSTEVSHRAKEFLKESGQANQKEIAMANIAENKTHNSQVKDLAVMMRTDHEKNLAQVQSLALAHGITLDPNLDMVNKFEVNHLRKANDADFDKEYTKAMLKGHVKCIRQFEKAAADIQEQDVKDYAQNTLPALRHHLQKSEEAARSAGVEESTISSILKELPNEDQGVTTR